MASKSSASSGRERIFRTHHGLEPFGVSTSGTDCNMETSPNPHLEAVALRLRTTLVEGVGGGVGQAASKLSASSGRERVFRTNHGLRPFASSISCTDCNMATSPNPHLEAVALRVVAALVEGVGVGGLGLGWVGRGG